MDWRTAEAEQHYLTTDEAASYLRKSSSWLNKVRVGLIKGDSPPFILLGNKILYRRAALDAWMLSREREANGWKS